MADICFDAVARILSITLSTLSAAYAFLEYHRLQCVTANAMLTGFLLPHAILLHPFLEATTPTIGFGEVG